MSIRQYIEAQPETTERTLQAARAALEGMGSASFDRVLLVGSGSSFNALSIVAPGLRRALQRPLEVVNPAVLLRSLGEVRGNPLVVILSQSGMSTTSIEVARVAKDRGWQTLVVTADPASPIGQLGLRILPLAIGAEPIGPKTKGFTASIAACLALEEALSGEALPEFSPARLAELVGSSLVDSRALVGQIGIPEYVVVAGSRRFLGVALEASLKISEIAGIAAAAFEPEELLHGRLHGMNAKSLGLMIVADSEEREIAVRTAMVMAERQVRIAIVNLTGEPTPYDWGKIAGNQPAPFDAIAVTIPFQWLAVELAVRKGMVPENMQYPGLSKALAIKVQVG